EGEISAWQYDRRAMVAAHSVKRDANLIRHGSLLAALAPATRFSEVGARPRPYRLGRRKQADYPRPALPCAHFPPGYPLLSRFFSASRIANGFPLLSSDCTGENLAPALRG